MFDKHTIKRRHFITVKIRRKVISSPEYLNSYIMTRKITAFLSGILILMIGCSNENTDDNTDENTDGNLSPTLRISWDKLPDHHCYLFISPTGTFAESKGDYHLSGDTSTIDYTWAGKDIGVLGIALEKLYVEEYGLYPQSDKEGHVYLKRNNQTVSMESQDLLIANAPQIPSGKSDTHLNFQYGMSKLIVRLSLSGVEGYKFDIQLNAVKDGYIDIAEGKVIPEGEQGSIYFSQGKTSGQYETVAIPQTLAKDATITITGMKNVGGKMLRINHPVSKTKLDNRQYIWDFNVNASGITFKEFSESPR